MRILILIHHHHHIIIRRLMSLHQHLQITTTQQLMELHQVQNKDPHHIQTRQQTQIQHQRHHHPMIIHPKKLKLYESKNKYRLHLFSNK